MTIISLAEKLRTEADAYLFLEDLRWGDQPVCPHCGSIRKPYFLKPRNGTSRATRTGNASERRVWKCADCRKQFSVLTGTIFHGTKISVRKWVFVIFEMCSSKNGVAAREIERKYDLDSKSAWFMLHRIREAMKREPMAGLLSGRVVADETWFGGKAKNRHANKRGDGRGRGTVGKTPVVALICHETGEVRAESLATVTGETLATAIRRQVDPARTHLHTDESKAYLKVSWRFASHSTVDHRAGEYARGDVSTNKAENFFSQLKRSIDGTHHHISPDHLNRYLAEFTFRHSTRKMTDSERMELLGSRFHLRRLYYREPPATSSRPRRPA